MGKSSRGAMLSMGEQPYHAPSDHQPEPSAGLRAIAYRSLAHVRGEPRHGAELVTQMVMGEEALVLGAREPWFQVHLADGYVGWIHQGSVVCSDLADVESYLHELETRRPAPDAWIVVARGAFARRDPGPDSPPVADLVQGARIRVDDHVEPPLWVILPDGTRGWIEPDAAVPAKRLADRFPARGKPIIEHAAEYVGLPYLWGGTSEKGFDCSGIVQRIYGLHGVPLPRDAHEQFRMGAPIEPGSSWEKVRDGDLAFFAEPPGERVTHVGILAAGGRLIHASTSRNGVAWDQLRSGDDLTPLGARLAAWLSGVRRVLPDSVY